MLFLRKITWLVAALAFLFVLFVPKLPVSNAFVFYMLFWITLASSFNMIYGFVGYLPFGFVMFYGVGTYITAILWSRFQIPIPVAILASGLAGILLALLFAPTLRLRGIYFSIVNFSCAMVLRILVANLPEGWTGGSFGITLSHAYQPILSYYFMAVLTAVTVVVAYLLLNSRLGIALRCIRDDETAASAMGINVGLCRLKAWILAALFPSLAGGVEAWYTAIVDPDTSFNLMITTKAIVYSMFGGLSTVIGPILGAVVMYSLDDLIWGTFPLLNLLVLGIIVVFLILFLPRGIVGTSTRKWPRLKAIVQ